MAKKKKKQKNNLIELEDEAFVPVDTSGLSKTLFAIFLSISLLMFAIAAISGFITGSTRLREKSVPAQVFDMTPRTDSYGNVYYYPVVEFYLPDSSRQRVQISEGSWPPAYQKGQPVTVLYDPAHPDSARIASVSGTLTLWILPLITGGLGAAFLAAALFARWISKPDPAQSAPETGAAPPGSPTIPE